MTADFPALLARLDDDQLTEVEVAMDRVSAAQSELDTLKNELAGLLSLLSESEE